MLPKPLALVPGTLAWALLFLERIRGWGGLGKSASVRGFLPGPCLRAFCGWFDPSPFDDVPTLLLFDLLDLFLTIFVDVHDVLLDLGELALKTGNLAVEVILLGLRLRQLAV